MVRVTEGREVKPGAGEEAFPEPGPVLHPSEPGFTSAVSSPMPRFGEVGQRPLECDHAGSTGLSSWAIRELAGRHLVHRQTVRRCRAGLSRCRGRLIRLVPGPPLAGMPG